MVLVSLEELIVLVLICTFFSFYTFFQVTVQVLEKSNNNRKYNNNQKGILLSTIICSLIIQYSEIKGN